MEIDEMKRNNEDDDTKKAQIQEKRTKLKPKVQWKKAQGMHHQCQALNQSNQGREEGKDLCVIKVTTVSRRTMAKDQKYLSMAMPQLFYQQWLLSSTAEINEYLSLELSGAWKPC